MLPNDFIFSQSSLQDYMDCPRRFELRYILRQPWPALESEPILEQERRMQQGQHFHQLVHRYLVGIPAEVLTPPSSEEELKRWWENFITYNPLLGLPDHRYPEYTLSTGFLNFRLLAKYDLVAIQPGQRAVIIDWKTSLRRTSSSTLKTRMQTRLYPFLLTLAGSMINGGAAIQPEQIEMIYWFVSEPGQPEIIHYSSKKYRQDQLEFEKIITSIQSHTPGTFMLTNEEKNCNYCVYRSLCERGTSAGDVISREDDEPDGNETPIDINFDQIGEISF